MKWWRRDRQVMTCGLSILTGRLRLSGRFEVFADSNFRNLYEQFLMHIVCVQAERRVAVTQATGNMGSLILGIVPLVAGGRVHYGPRAVVRVGGRRASCES